MIVTSVVSHGHAAMLPPLVADLLRCQEVSRIIVTLNIPEGPNLPKNERLLIIRNSAPKGFGANHNAAFKTADRYSDWQFFCPINPDVNLPYNPFPILLAAMDLNAAGISAPLVINIKGQVEDSLRRFPSVRSLASKALRSADGSYKPRPGDPALFPEWAAGIFMLIRRDVFGSLNGFDERFFLYYEDVDICARAWKRGFRIVACPQASVIHEARRDSHRRLCYMRWHLVSMARYFYRHWGRLPRREVINAQERSPV